MDVALLAASLGAVFLPSPFHREADELRGGGEGNDVHADDSIDGPLASDRADMPPASSKVGIGKRGRAAVRTVRISLFLSLLLLSLGVLEAAPSSWLLLLDSDAGLPYTYSADDREGNGVGAPYLRRRWMGALNGDGQIRLTAMYRGLMWAECTLVALYAPSAACGIAAAWMFPPCLESASSPPPALGGGGEGVMTKMRMNRCVSLAVGVVVRLFLGLRFALGLLVAVARFAVRRAFGGGGGKRTALTHSMSAVSIASSSSDLERTAIPSSVATPSPSRLTRKMITPAGRGSSRWRWRPNPLALPSRAFFAGAILGATASFLLLHAVGSFVIAPSVDGRSLLGDIVSRICALGVLLSQILNGFGCVSLPYSCMSGLYLEPIDARTLADAQESYKCLRRDVEDKRRILADHLRAARRDDDHDLPSAATHSGLATLDVRRRCLLSGRRRSRQQQYPPEDAAAEVLRREIEFMENLSQELADDIEDMKDLRRTAAAARTTLGRMRGWVGVTFSVVLLVRVCLAIFGLARSSSAKTPPSAASLTVIAPDVHPRRKDPITAVLLFLVGQDLLGRGGEYDAAAQCMSLVLAAFLSVTQVRTFLRASAALGRRVGAWLQCGGGCGGGDSDGGARDNDCFASASSSLSTWRGAMRDAGTHIVASVLGCYFLACVVLMKRNLPLEHRSAFSTALGRGMDPIAFDARVTDGTFAASALTSTFVLCSLFGIRRRNSAAHNLRGFGRPDSIKTDV